MIRDILHYGRTRQICPDCRRPQNLKITCRHCESEYPPQTATDEVVEKILRLAVGIPVAVVVLMAALIIGTLLV
jgi:hypothetical protein